MAAPARASTPVPMFSDRILGTLKAPGAGDDSELELVDGALRCRQTGRPHMNSA